MHLDACRCCARYAEICAQLDEERTYLAPLGELISEHSAEIRDLLLKYGATCPSRHSYCIENPTVTKMSGGEVPSRTNIKALEVPTETLNVDKDSRS